MPTYKCEYEQHEEIDGTYYLHFCITQMNVPESFIMYLPIRLDFGEGRTFAFKAGITGATSEFDIPYIPLKKKRVEFNAFNSVLCKIKD